MPEQQKEVPKMTKEEIHELLQHSFDRLTSLYGQCEGLSTDTVFAIGLAAGTLSQAKALVGRDIDNAR